MKERKWKKMNVLKNKQKHTANYTIFIFVGTELGIGPNDSKLGILISCVFDPSTSEFFFLFSRFSFTLGTESISLSYRGVCHSSVAISYSSIEYNTI